MFCYWLIAERIHSFHNDYQCDQIWRNFANLAQFKASLAQLEALFGILQPLKLAFASFECIWAKFHCCVGQRLKYNLAIRSQ